MVSLAGSSVSIPNVDIKVSGSPISDDMDSALVTVEIDNNLYLPDTATLKFLLDVMENPLTKFADTNMKEAMNQGSELIITDGSKEIFNGEIVSVGIEFNAVMRTGGTYLIVQAFDQSHRLHRGRKTETFLQMSLSDVASKVINDSSLNPDVDATTGVLDYVIQSNQTDWEFLWQLAERIGYEIYVQKNKVCFKKPRQTTGSPIELEWGEDFIQFRSRKSTVKQVPKVKVRAWDRNTKKAIIGEASSGNGTPDIGDARTGGSQASAAFGDSALVIVDTPLSTQDDATKLAQSVLDALAGEFIQAEGTTPEGNSDLLPGVKVNLKGLGDNSGQYLVTSTNHILNKSEGQSTTFKIGGRNPLTFLPNTGSKHNTSTGSARIQGIVLGLITNNEDPDGQCRVKIEFPWLDEKVESDWAPIATLGGGNKRGFQWLPAVGDQALVAFEHGDIHRPYVIGTIWSEKDLPPSSNADLTGPDGTVDKIQVKSREGQTLTIDDTSGKRSIGLSNPDDDSKITINHDDQTVEILSNGDIKITGSKGKITVTGSELEVKSSGNLTIEASANVDIKAGANLSLTGGVQANFEGQITAIKGVQTKLEASAMAEIKGPLVKIN